MQSKSVTFSSHCFCFSFNLLCIFLYNRTFLCLKTLAFFFFDTNLICWVNFFHLTFVVVVDALKFVHLTWLGHYKLRKTSIMRGQYNMKGHKIKSKTLSITICFLLSLFIRLSICMPKKMVSLCKVIESFVTHHFGKCVPRVFFFRYIHLIDRTTMEFFNPFS